MRKEDVTTWTLCQTSGQYLSVGVDGEDIYAAVRRTINDVGVVFVERFDQDRMMDASVVLEPSAATDTVTGLDHFDDEVCQVYADYLRMGDETPSSGSVTIDQEASTRIEVGLGFPDVKELAVQGLTHRGWTEKNARREVYDDPDAVAEGIEVWVRDMPIEPNLPDGTVVGQRKRVVSAAITVNDTRQFKFRANGGTAKTINGRKIGAELLDLPPPVFSATVEVEGLLGWTDRGLTEVMQDGPGPLTLLGVTRRAIV